MALHYRFSRLCPYRICSEFFQRIPILLGLVRSSPCPEMGQVGFSELQNSLSILFQVKFHFQTIRLIILLEIFEAMFLSRASSAS